MNDFRKCAIIGCGFVGASTAYTFMQQRLFSELVLIDSNFEKAKGEASDMMHGISFLSPMSIYAGEYKDLTDCSVIVIAAGAGQKAGESRLDLLSRNVQILFEIITNIKKYNDTAILLVLSNPVDILTYAALRFSRFPANRVFGSGTVLDTARLKQLVGTHLAVDPRNVHTFIIGEHGDSELAVWSSANISGINIGDYCSLFGNDASTDQLYALFEEVRDSAYEIISQKGATYYAIAQACARIVRCIIRDEKSILPVSTLVNGHYGEENVCFGVPCIVGKNGVEKVFDIPLDEYESKRLSQSVALLKSVISDLNIEKR